MTPLPPSTRRSWTGSTPCRAGCRSISAARRPLERRREAERARARREKLAETSPADARQIHGTIDFFNGKPGDPASFDALHRFLEDQPYRLAHWKSAFDEINYRRFFDVNDLAGLKVERDAVFDAVHRLRAGTAGRRQGPGPAHRPPRRHGRPRPLLRPPAGLLPARGGPARPARRARPHGGGGEAAGRLARRGSIRKRLQERLPPGRCTRFARRISLAPGESLDPRWAVDGTSGYDFLADVERLCVDPRGASALRGVYERFIDQRVSRRGDRLREQETDHAPRPWPASPTCWRACSTDLRGGPPLAGLHAARKPAPGAGGDRSMLSGQPHLRDRARAGDRPRPRGDRARRAAARRRNPALEASISSSSSARSTCSPRRRSWSPSRCGGGRWRFAMKFQQYTAPVQAKGVEDTAFYRCHALISANEVGSHPALLGGTIEQFHEANGRRAAERPRALLATETHDTKRGEDARARIDVLSEIPEEWEAAAAELDCAANRGGQASSSRSATPRGRDANDEYMFYQVLLGAWDFAREDEHGAASLRERLAGLHGEVPCAKGEGAHELDRRRTKATRKGSARRIRREGAFFQSGPSWRASGLRAPRRGAGRGVVLGAAGLGVRLARRGGLLSRKRVLGLEPGGSRQPPPGRFRRPAGGSRGFGAAA